MMLEALQKPARRGPKPRKPIARKTAPRRSTKRIPRVTQTVRGKEEARLNALFSKAIRLRDPFCRIRAICNGDRSCSTDAAHIFAKSTHPRIRWDMRNAVGACRECHVFMTQRRQMWTLWIQNNVSGLLQSALLYLAALGPSPDRAEVCAALTAAIKESR